jgi:hypothetical protein
MGRDRWLGGPRLVRRSVFEPKFRPTPLATRSLLDTSGDVWGCPSAAYRLMLNDEKRHNLLPPVGVARGGRSIG